MPEEAAEVKTVADVWCEVFAWIFSRLLLAFMFLLPFALGCFVGGVALHDPDTCWLLSLGRYIFEHHALPATDPFSYTFALQPGKPFIMYQWLSEFFFYCAYAVAGLPGLLAFAALLLGQSFLVFPLRLASRFSPVCMASLLTILGVFASCFHYLVRPEIVSYILMSVCIVLLRKVYSAKDSDPVQWRTVAALIAVMLIWTNAHSAFVLGLILQFTILLVTYLQSRLQKYAFPGSSKTALVAFVGSVVASFLNPYGAGLWVYLPGLFFAKFNHRIAELRPIQLSDLHDFTYYPFIALVVICFWIIAKAAIRAKRSNGQLPWSNIIVICICTFYGFKARRIIPFSVLMMIAQASELWLTMPNDDSSAEKTTRTFQQTFEEKFADVFDPNTWLWPVTVAVLSLAGCYFTFGKIAAPTIPQASKAFIAPTKIIDYLRANKQVGHVFNDAQFGDMLIRYAPEVPVFIDTRYDMHGEPLVADYVEMMSASGDWQSLFERYKIDWIFVPPSAPIASKLLTDPDWSTVIKDDSAVVLKRARKHEGL